MRRLMTIVLAGLCALLPAGVAQAATNDPGSVFSDMWTALDSGARQDPVTARVFTACSDLPITWATYVAPGASGVKAAAVQASVQRALEQITDATSGRYVFEHVDAVSAHRMTYSPGAELLPGASLLGSPLVPSTYVDMLVVVAPTGAWVNGGPLTTAVQGYTAKGGIENKATLTREIVPVRKGATAEISAQAWNRATATKRDAYTSVVTQWMLGRLDDTVPVQAKLNASSRDVLAAMATTSCQLHAARPELSSQSTTLLPELAETPLGE